jgi:hypothetical protein
MKNKKNEKQKEDLIKILNKYKNLLKIKNDFKNYIEIEKWITKLGFFEIRRLNQIIDDIKIELDIY